MSDDRYILDGKSFVDTKTNQCLNFGIKDLARVTITLNNMDMWLNQAEERIAELEEQLKNARKETANKVIKRVEELSVFDFQSYEEMGFRRYIISEMALDNILKEYGGSDGC